MSAAERKYTIIKAKTVSSLCLHVALFLSMHLVIVLSNPTNLATPQSKNQANVLFTCLFIMFIESSIGLNFKCSK